MAQFSSNAEWPKGTCPALDDKTEDIHNTEKDAEAVCAMLESLGYGGDGKV